MTEPIVERFADLARRVCRRPARLGDVRAVAVDGPSGSGKTSFARRLAAALESASDGAGTGRPGDAGGAPGTLAARVPVVVVHTDDLLDGWDDQFTFWHRLESGVLAPLARGRPGSHPCYDWHRGRFVGTRPVPVPDVLVVEGSGSVQAAFRHRLTLAVFVTAPGAVRWRRVIRRDGPGVAGPLRRWNAAEAAAFQRDRPWDAVDLVVDGASDLRHDPEREYIHRPVP